MKDTANSRLFLRMYLNAVQSGMIADMGAERWTTLCVLASHMNDHGECYPTQATIAKELGVSRQTASKYIHRLLEYRWKGKPLVTAEKVRDEKGRWVRTYYKIQPESGLSIFGYAM